MKPTQHNQENKKQKKMLSLMKLGIFWITVHAERWPNAWELDEVDGDTKTSRLFLRDSGRNGRTQELPKVGNAH